MARASSSLASATLIKLVYEQPLRCDALSRRQLGKTSKMAKCWNGIQGGLKNRCPYGRGGSSPLLVTNASELIYLACCLENM